MRGNKWRRFTHIAWTVSLLAGATGRPEPRVTSMQGSGPRFLVCVRSTASAAPCPDGTGNTIPHGGISPTGMKIFSKRSSGRNPGLFPGSRRFQIFSGFSNPLALFNISMVERRSPMYDSISSILSLKSSSRSRLSDSSACNCMSLRFMVLLLPL